MLRGPKPGRWTRYAQFDRPNWIAVVVGLAVGGALLAIGIDEWHDHYLLEARGVVTTGRIVEVQGGKRTSLTVQFTTAAGDEVTAEVIDPSASTKQEEGAPITLRYDPQAPDRVADVKDDVAVGSRWLLVAAGGALLAGTGWAAWRLVSARTGRARGRGRAPR